MTIECSIFACFDNTSECCICVRKRERDARVARQKCISNWDNRGTGRDERNEHLKRHRSLLTGLKMSMKLDRLGLVHAGI